MKRPTLEESGKRWLKLSINTRESTYSLHPVEQDKYIDQLEAENKKLKEALKSVKAEDDIYYCNSCHAFFEEECACEDDEI